MMTDSGTGGAMPKYLAEPKVRPVCSLITQAVQHLQAENNDGTIIVIMTDVGIKFQPAADLNH